MHGRKRRRKVGIRKGKWVVGRNARNRKNRRKRKKVEKNQKNENEGDERKKGKGGKCGLSCCHSQQLIYVLYANHEPFTLQTFETHAGSSIPFCLLYSFLSLPFKEGTRGISSLRYLYLIELQTPRGDGDTSLLNNNRFF